MALLKKTGRTVRLIRFEFPKYWEDIIEPVISGDQAVSRMKELLARFELKKADGITFYLEDESGEQLQVYCSASEWAVAYFPKDATSVISSGNPERDGTMVFLIP